MPEIALEMNPKLPYHKTFNEAAYSDTMVVRNDVLFIRF